MMVAEVAHHKRGNNRFLLSCEGASRKGCLTAAKRLRTSVDGNRGGGGEENGSTNSVKEKKDKITERVATLQRLVSPFGKSDTASVLLEVTEYIKFLHDQLQVLSTPYLRGTTANQQESEYCSLRSRGLCLVPEDCTLAIGHSNGADMWAPIKTNDPRL